MYLVINLKISINLYHDVHRDTKINHDLVWVKFLQILRNGGFKYLECCNSAMICVPNFHMFYTNSLLSSVFTLLNNQQLNSF